MSYTLGYDPFLCSRMDVLLSRTTVTHDITVILIVRTVTLLKFYCVNSEKIQLKTPIRERFFMRLKPLELF